METDGLLFTHHGVTVTYTKAALLNFKSACLFEKFCQVVLHLV